MSKVRPRLRNPLSCRGRATRRRLLQSTEREFSQKGHHQTSVSSIVSRVGLAVGTFYQYFEDKDDALGALVRELAKSLRHHLAAERQSQSAIRAYAHFRARHSGLDRIVRTAAVAAPEAYREYYVQLAEAVRAERCPGQGHAASVREGLLIDEIVRVWLAAPRVGSTLGLAA